MRPGLRSGALACCLVASAQPGVWARALAGYEDDDFWTLGLAGRAGLALVSLCLIAALPAGAGWVSRRIAARRADWRARAAGDAAFKAAACGALLWASPQAFYLFYRAIIPALPPQWVLRAPDAERALAALAFAPDGRAAAHLAAAVFWGLILQAIRAQTRGGPRLALTALTVAAPVGLTALGA